MVGGVAERGGAWLFPEIGLAATLHLDCRDRDFRLAQLKTTQQVNRYITLEQEGKWMGERKEDKNTHESWMKSEWNKYVALRQASENWFCLCSSYSEMNLHNWW